jgi:hypothetical protein
MPFLELFSSSFLLTIAIVVILIGIVFAYISYRMTDQDHKISSMVSLVSTMAEELQFFRAKMNTLPSTATTFQQYSHPMHARNDGSLIEVSDDEYDESEDESEDEDESDDENNVENEYNSSTNQDNSDDDYDNDDASHASDESDHIKSIHLDDLEPFDEPSLNDDVMDLTTLPIPHIDETVVHEEEDIKDNPELKTISITEDIDDSTNYKRMSLSKLRNIVVEKGLISDSSKMKKQELLKLLGEE